MLSQGKDILLYLYTGMLVKDHSPTKPLHSTTVGILTTKSLFITQFYALSFFCLPLLTSLKLFSLNVRQRKRQCSSTQAEMVLDMTSPCSRKLLLIDSCSSWNSWNCSVTILGWGQLHQLISRSPLFPLHFPHFLFPPSNISLLNNLKVEGWGPCPRFTA